MILFFMIEILHSDKNGVRIAYVFYTMYRLSKYNLLARLLQSWAAVPSDMEQSSIEKSEAICLTAI